MAKGERNIKGFNQPEHDDGLDEIFSSGNRDNKERRSKAKAKAKAKGKGRNENKELTAFNEVLGKNDPSEEIERAGDEIENAGDLALQETQELIPEGATSAQEALIENADERIRALVAETDTQLDALTQELENDLRAQQERQQLGKAYLDVFTNALRIEMERRDMDSQEVVIAAYHQAADKARERVEISEELEKSLFGKMNEILGQIQDELLQRVIEEEKAVDGSDSNARQPQAGVNDFSALAALRDQLPDRPVVAESKTGKPEKKTFTSGKARPKKVFPDDVDSYIIPASRRRNATIRGGSAHLEQSIDSAEELEKFRQVFTSQLMRELKSSGMPRDPEILDNIYRRTLDKVFEDFNAELPVINKNYIDPRKHADQELFSRKYGTYVEKISRDRAVEIAREMRLEVERYLMEGVSPSEFLVDKINKLTENDILANSQKLSVEVLPQVEIGKKETKEEILEIPIDFSRIEPGFAIIWRTPKSKERGTVVSVADKTILIGRKTEKGKIIRVPKIQVVAVLNQYGEPVMGEGSRIVVQEIKTDVIKNKGEALDKEEVDKLLAQLNDDFTKDELEKLTLGDINESDSSAHVLEGIESQKTQLLEQLDHIEYVVKSNVDTNVKSLKDSQGLGDLIDIFRSKVDKIASSDIHNLQQKIEVLQSMLQEYIDASKTFDLKEFIDEYAQRTGLELPIASQDEIKKPEVQDALLIDALGSTELTESTQILEQKIAVLNSQIIDATDQLKALVEVDKDSYDDDLTTLTKLKIRLLSVQDSILLSSADERLLLDAELSGIDDELKILLEKISQGSSPAQENQGIDITKETEATDTPIEQLVLKISFIIESIKKQASGGDFWVDLVQQCEQYQSELESLNKQIEQGQNVADANITRERLLIIEDDLRFDFLNLNNFGYHFINESETQKSPEEQKEDIISHIEDIFDELGHFRSLRRECEDSIKCLDKRSSKIFLKEFEDEVFRFDIIKNSLWDKNKREWKYNQLELEQLTIIVADLDGCMSRFRSLLERVTQAHLEDYIAEGKEEFEKLTPEDQQKVSLGIRNMGFIAKEKKSHLFASVFDRLASNKTFMGRYAGALAQTYHRDAESAHRLIELAEERKNTGNTFGLGLNKSRFMSAATTIGMIAKVGRTVTDLIGVSLASPLRYVMMGAMGAARASEAGKEMRISSLAEENPNIIHQTDWETLMHNWIEFQKEFKDSGKSEEELLENFRTLAVASDIKERIKEIKDSQKGLGVVQNILQVSIPYTLDAIDKKLLEIDGDTGLSENQITQEKIAVLKKYAQYIKELEHTIDAYGKVDVLARSLKYTEKASKALVIGMTVETLVLSADALYDSVVALAKKSHELIDSIEHSIAQRFDSLNSEPVPVSGSLPPSTGSTSQLIMGVRGVVPTHSSVVPSTSSALSGNTVEINTSPTPSSNGSVINTGEFPTTSIPIVPEAPSTHGVAQATEAAHTTSFPIEVAPTNSKNLVEDFTKNHLLYEKTGAEITSDVNGIKVEYEIGGAKGDFATLDQALRRVVAQEITIDSNGKFNAVEATRAENVLANLRQLLEGKAVGDIKPTELSGIAEFKDGKLTILDYKKFDEFIDSKLFARAAEKITEANIATGYSQTSTEKWQEMLGEKTSIDFSSTDTESITEKSVVVAPSAPEPASDNVGAIDKLLGKMPDSNIDSNPKLVLGEMGDIDASLESQLLGKMPASSIEVGPLKEVVIDTTPYPAEYMRDVFEKMTPDQSSALAEVMREAKIDGEKWEDINFIIEGNTDLLRNADGKFDVNQVELALELSNTPRPKPSELRIALEAMKVLDLEQAQEVAIVQAIMNPKEGPKVLEKLFGDSSDNRGAKVTLNPRKGILHFENLGPQKLDGNMNFREGFVRIGKRAGAVFGGKFPLKNLVQAINSFK